MTTYTHRIRRCRGNRDAWALVALTSEGEEAPDFGGIETATTIDALLRHSRGLLPSPEDVVQIVYYEESRQ